MPEETLNYQTPNRDGGKGLRAAAWICSLVLGIIQALVGSVFGLFILLAIAQGNVPRRGIDAFVFFLFVALVIGAVVIGICNMAYSNDIRRSSRRATTIVQRLAIAVVAALLLMMLALIFIASPSGRGVPLFLGFFLALIAPHIILSAICGRALRHPSALTE